MAKKDLINGFPSDPSAQKAIKNSVKEVVDSLLRIEAEKEQIKSVFEVAEEKYGVDKSFVKTQAELMYDYLYNEGKKKAKIEEAAEMVEVFNSEIVGGL